MYGTIRLAMNLAFRVVMPTFIFGALLVIVAGFLATGTISFEAILFVLVAVITEAAFGLLLLLLQYFDKCTSETREFNAWVNAPNVPPTAKERSSSSIPMMRLDFFVDEEPTRIALSPRDVVGATRTRHQLGFASETGRSAAASLSFRQPR